MWQVTLQHVRLKAEKNLCLKHSSHLLFKNSKFSTLPMQVPVSSHMEAEETSKGRKYKEQCRCHNLWHNLCHNSPIWWVIIGGGVDPPSPVHQPQLATWASCGTSCTTSYGTNISQIENKAKKEKLHVT